MSNFTDLNFPSIDPWTASSLLQKSIRRGDVELAKFAMRTLFRQRRNAVWRRIVNIAFEDVGIADIDLLHEVSRLACDAQLRTFIGGDEEVAVDLCQQLALATKDRSADYLYCAALKLPSCAKERAQIYSLGTDHQLDIIADRSQRLERRAVALLVLCTERSEGKRAVANPSFFELLERLECEVPNAALSATALAAAKRCDALVLMAPLLWTAFAADGAESNVEKCKAPINAVADGLPLYTFDMHTSIGKRAIARFSEECPEVRDVLLRYVPMLLTKSVAQWAAFYADASSIVTRLSWARSRYLEEQGIRADLMFAGCPEEGVIPIVDCVRRNLDHLNAIRRSLVEVRKTR